LRPLFPLDVSAHPQLRHVDLPPLTTDTSKSFHTASTHTGRSLLRKAAIRSASPAPPASGPV